MPNSVEFSNGHDPRGEPARVPPPPEPPKPPSVEHAEPAGDESLGAAEPLEITGTDMPDQPPNPQSRGPHSSEEPRSADSFRTNDPGAAPTSIATQFDILHLRIQKDLADMKAELKGDIGDVRGVANGARGIAGLTLAILLAAFAYLAAEISGNRDAIDTVGDKVEQVDQRVERLEGRVFPREQ